MKKILPVVIVVLIVVFGLILLKNQKGQPPNTQTSEKNIVNQTSKNIVQGIKDLIATNTSIKCTYEIPDGGKVTSFVKGKDKIRSTIENNNQKTETIFVNGKMYSWDDKTKQGMVMTIKNLPEQTTQEKTTVEDPEKYIEQMEKMKASCQKENFSDSVFQPPTDVKFQDLDKLQEMMQMEK
ncbi:MAG: hypothetical protein QHH09_01300 [Microgenomates group bacterium]|nr:hypothetical protein [Microgenomates group bacterium]